MSACTCASLNQRSNPLLPTCHLHELRVDGPKEGPEGPVRGGGLFLRQHAWTHHARASSSQPCPLQASCFLCQLLSCLSLSSFSWSLSSPSAGKWGFEDRARGSHWHNGRPYLKVPSKPLKIIKFSLQFQFGEGSDLLKVFVYRPNNFNFRSDCGTYGIPFIIGIFGREITKNTAIYGVYIRFWPTLLINDTWSDFLTSVFSGPKMLNVVSNSLGLISFSILFLSARCRCFEHTHLRGKLVEDTGDTSASTPPRP